MTRGSQVVATLRETNVKIGRLVYYNLGISLHEYVLCSTGETTRSEIHPTTCSCRYPSEARK